MSTGPLTVIVVGRRKEHGECRQCAHYAGRGQFYGNDPNVKLPCQRYPQTVLKSASDTCGEFEYYVGR